MYMYPSHSAGRRPPSERTRFGKANPPANVELKIARRLSAHNIASHRPLVHSQPVEFCGNDSKEPGYDVGLWPGGMYQRPRHRDVHGNLTFTIC